MTTPTTLSPFSLVFLGFVLGLGCMAVGAFILSWHANQRARHEGYGDGFAAGLAAARRELSRREPVPIYGKHRRHE